MTPNRPVLPSLQFPTALHRQVAEITRDFFAAHEPVDTALVVNSCARGQAVLGSDLDLAVLIKPATTGQEVQDLEKQSQEFKATQPLVCQFRSGGQFWQVHLDFFDAQTVPAVWDDGDSPDSLEIERRKAGAAGGFPAGAAADPALVIFHGALFCWRHRSRGELRVA